MYMHVCSMKKTEVSIVLSKNRGKGLPTREPNHHADGENYLSIRNAIVDGTRKKYT